MAGRPRLTSATLGFVNCQILKSICQLASLKFFSSTLRNKMNQIETSLHQLCLWKKLIFKPRCSKMTLATSSVWCSSEALRGISFFVTGGQVGRAGQPPTMEKLNDTQSSRDSMAKMERLTLIRKVDISMALSRRQ